MVHGLDPSKIGGAAPVAVELSEDHGLELLWDQPVPNPVAPWVAVGQGWSWHLPYDPDAPVPDDEYPCPIPALVTIGHREARTALGAFEDGDPVIPASDKTTNTLRISDRVVTDLTLLRQWYEDAQDLPSSEAIARLTQALDLVHGPPFAGAGYEWAHEEQDATDATILIEEAALHLVDLATDAGKPRHRQRRHHRRATSPTRQRTPLPSQNAPRTRPRKQRRCPRRLERAHSHPR